MNKYRFRWCADGADHETIIEAPDYPMACFRLGIYHIELWQTAGKLCAPADFKLDLSKPEIVE